MKKQKSTYHVSYFGFEADVKANHVAQAFYMFCKYFKLTKPRASREGGWEGVSIYRR